jgi:hypothetical protein
MDEAKKHGRHYKDFDHFMGILLNIQETGEMRPLRLFDYRLWFYSHPECRFRQRCPSLIHPSNKAPLRAIRFDTVAMGR